MPGHDIIVIGASAGGVEALKALVARLPEDLPASLFIVLHLSPHGTSLLPNILNRAGPLLAVHPQDRQPIENGRIYAAPSDMHLLVKNGYVTLSRGPRENGHRPAVDPMFRTAARYYGSRVVGVILSGTLDDGTAGMLAVKLRNGVTIVQDPEEALFAGMPNSAIEHVSIDHVARIEQIAELLIQYAHEPVPSDANTVVSDTLEVETDMAELEDIHHGSDQLGNPSAFACPECGGALREIHHKGLVRFRCRVGHSYSAQTLLAEQSDAVEDALWVALRALEESASLSDRLAERSREQGRHFGESLFAEQAASARVRAEVIRRALQRGSLTLNEENGKINREQAIGNLDID
ncbi:MAG: chemotaxis protein CheB [Chloroflexi bacterium]|nr:chemotaxis protein CheB [Chloroflexota bacterium]